MRRVVSLWLLAMVLLAVAPTSSDAWRQHGGGHGRVFISVGPAFWWGPPYPYPWYYPAPYYAYAPPPVVVQEPPVYSQVTPAPAPPAQAYWYYCPSAGAYYPTTPTCPEAWVKVPPRPE